MELRSAVIRRQQVPTKAPRRVPALRPSNNAVDAVSKRANDARQVNAGVFVIQDAAGRKTLGTTWDLRNASAQHGPGLRVLERVAPPPASNGRGFDAGEMEKILVRRLAHHQRLFRARAARVLVRAMVRPVMEAGWLKWTERVQIDLKLENEAAVIDIQRLMRGRRGRRIATELEMQRAAHRLRRFLAAAVLTLEVRRRVESRRRVKAAKRIQCSVRRWERRVLMVNVHDAVRRWRNARKIQAAWRGRCGRLEARRKRFEMRKMHAVLDIQRVARGYLERKRTVKLRRKRKETKAVVEIQRIWRGCSARLTVDKLRSQRAMEHEAAKRIEKWWTRCLAAKEALNEAVNGVLNAVVNAVVAMHEASVGPAEDFGNLSEADFMTATAMDENTAATTLQAYMKRHWRKRRRARAFELVCRAVKAAMWSRRSRIAVECNRNTAASTIQVSWRNHRLWMAIRSHVNAKQETAATRIQRGFRHIRFKRTENAVYIAAVEAPMDEISILQQPSEEELRTRAATTMQTLARRRIARREVERRKQLLAALTSTHSSANIKNVSTFVCEECRATQAASVVLGSPSILQLCETCKDHRASLLSTLGMVDGPLSSWEISTFHNRLLPGVRALQHRVRRLQAQWTSKFGFCDLCSSRAARLVCASCGRGSSTDIPSIRSDCDRSRLHCCLSCDVIVHPAANTRMSCHSRIRIDQHYGARQSAAIRIQRATRRWSTTRKQRAVLEHIQGHASRVIGRAVRSRLRRRQLLADQARKRRGQLWMSAAASVRLVQLLFRAKSRLIVRENFAAAVVQSAVRRWIIVRKWQITVDSLRRRSVVAATSIQRHVRGRADRLRVLQIRADRAQELADAEAARTIAAIDIQRIIRGSLTRHRVRLLRLLLRSTRSSAARHIQRAWRAWRKQKKLIHSSAVRIQSTARRWLATRAVTKLRAQRRLERMARMRSALRAQCVHAENTAATTIQRMARMKLRKTANARNRVRRIARLFLMRRAMENLCVADRAARKLQQAFRLARATRKLSQQVMNEVEGSVDDPRAWVELLDEQSGCVYYFNLVTRESVWERPAALEQAAEEEAASEWVQYWDENVGAAYYYNQNTGEATWAPPAGFVDDNQAPEDAGHPLEQAYDPYSHYAIPAPSKLDMQAAGNDDNNAAYMDPQQYYYYVDPSGGGGDVGGAAMDEQQYYYWYYDNGKAEEGEEGPDTTYNTDYRIYVTQLDAATSDEGSTAAADNNNSTHGASYQDPQLH